MRELQRIGIGDHDQSLFEVFYEQREDGFPPGLIEVLQGLVEEQDARLMQEGPGPPQALLHARRKEAGQAITGQAEVLAQSDGALVIDTAQFAEEGEVFVDGELGIELQIGGHIADRVAPFRGIEGAIVDGAADGAALGSHQSGQAAQQSAFARTVGAGDEQHLTVIDVAVQVVQDAQAPEAAAQFLESELGSRHAAIIDTETVWIVTWGEPWVEIATVMGVQSCPMTRRETPGFGSKRCPFRRLVTPLGLVVSLVLGGCASLVAPPRPAASPDLPVVDIEHLEVRALLLLLADRQIYESFAVSRALEADASVRELLALTLARAGRPEGIGALEGLLADAEPRVRRAAAFALGELGEDGFRDGAQALLGALGDSDREVGRLAVEALAKQGVRLESVVTRLIAVPTEEFFPRLLPALFRFSADEENAPSAVRWAEQGLEVADAALHAMAAYALARYPQVQGAGPLRELLADADPWVRGLAARGLGRIGDRFDMERLRPLLDDAEAGPIIQALRAGRRLIGDGKVAAPESWQPRLLELLADPRPGVRFSAIEASAAWLLDDELGVALERAVGSELPRERALALLALAEGEDPRAAALVVRFATDPDPVLRARAAEAAGLYRALQVVEQLATDAVPGVRIAAFETLLASRTESGLEVARRGLRDVDPAVRAVVLSWAAEHPLLTMEELLEALILTRRDAIDDARLAAVQALGARAGAEPLERGAIVAKLEELSRDESYLVRRQAISELGDLEREAPPLGSSGTERTTQVYREIVQRTARPRWVDLETERGAIRLRLACPEAPLTCLNFLQLAGQGFFDGLTFHRVVPDFVVQAGDPRGDGWGGPGYSLRDEINLLRYDRGALGMALSGPDTGGSQFFITLSPQPHLDGGYTVFGEVVSRGSQPDSDEILDRIVQGDRILKVIEVTANRTN